MNDSTLRQYVLDELDFEPSIDAADIGVAAEDSIVTLTGHVPTYAQKLTVEDVVHRVKGVKGTAQEIEVRPFGTNRTADDEIAKRAVNLIGWNTSIPDSAVQVKVQKGRVTLTGKVEWQYQKVAVANAVRDLSGVVGIANQIEIKLHVSAFNVKKRIEDALKRKCGDRSTRDQGQHPRWRQGASGGRGAYLIRAARSRTSSVVCPPECIWSMTASRSADPDQFGILVETLCGAKTRVFRPTPV